jgi:hypothetical protein
MQIEELSLTGINKTFDFTNLLNLQKGLKAQ